MLPRDTETADAAISWGAHMRNSATRSIKSPSPTSAGSRRDRLTEVVCGALALALLTLAGRIIALW